MKDKLAAWFWRNRSWKGKTAVILGSVFLALIVIGLAVPAPEDEPPVAQETTTEQTTEEETTEATPPEPPPPPPPVVAKVIDGDTLRLHNGETVRLVQIDAPERKGECYGKKSADVLRQLLPAGTEVRIVRDPKLDDTDRTGRLLRYVFDGKKHINLAVVQKGAASIWFFDGERGRYADKLLAAAKRAQASERGAWGACEARLTPERSFQTRAKQVESPPPPSAPNCHPSYEGECLDPSVSDYDCAGGSGDGPGYVYGTVRVVGNDEYGLDGDGDGYGCE